jgi:hypothetical protein
MWMDVAIHDSTSAASLSFGYNMVILVMLLLKSRRANTVEALRIIRRIWVCDLELAG